MRNEKEEREEEGERKAEEKGVVFKCPFPSRPDEKVAQKVNVKIEAEKVPEKISAQVHPGQSPAELLKVGAAAVQDLILTSFKVLSPNAFNEKEGGGNHD